jgi:hypothetical protein
MGKNMQLKASQFVFVYKILLEFSNRKDEISGIFSTYGRDKKCNQIFNLKTLREEITPETWISIRRQYKVYRSRMWAGFIWLRKGPVGVLRQRQESSGSIKDGNFLTT